MWIKALALTQERRWPLYIIYRLRRAPSRISREPIRDGEPVRIAIVGMGRHARSRLVPAIREELGLSLKLAVTRRTDPGADYPQTGELSDLLSNPEIQAAVISVPTSILAQVSSLCLSAGLHVYCECPAVLSDGDLRGIRRAVESGGQPAFMTGYHIRGLAEIQPMAVVAREKRVGWKLEATFHSLYHLTDLAHFLLGDTPLRRIDASASDVRLEFSSGHTADLRLRPGPLTVRMEGSDGTRFVSEIPPFGPNHYAGILQNFEATARGRASPLCGIESLSADWSAYKRIRMARVRHRINGYLKGGSQA